MMGNNEIDEFQSFEIDGYSIEMKLNNQLHWMFKVDGGYWHQTCTHLYEKAIDLVKHELKQRQNEYTPGERCLNCDGKGIVIMGYPGWETECPYCDGVGIISQQEMIESVRNDRLNNWPETEDSITDAWHSLTQEQRRAIAKMIGYQ